MTTTKLALLLQLTDEQKKWLDVLRLKGTTRQGQKDSGLNPVNRIRRYSNLLPSTFNVGLLDSIPFSCSTHSRPHDCLRLLHTKCTAHVLTERCVCLQCVL